MIRDEAVEAYNNRVRATLNDLNTMTPGQLDAVKANGSRAEALLKNPDLVMFLHQFRFDTADQLASVIGHTDENNAQRVALANYLSGIDSFIASLQRAVYMKNRAVANQGQSNPASKEPTKDIYTP